jgi:hypothetical protein
MTQVQMPSSLRRILMITLSLMIVSTAVVVAIGESTQSMYSDISQLNLFLENSEEIQPDFERSLEIYTEETKQTKDFLSKLRPYTEEELVVAISSIEAVGRKLFLNISLRSIEAESEENDSIGYQISFYGTKTDLQNFLKELEKLLLYIRVEEINFKEVKFLNDQELIEENTHIKIKLYTK